MEAIARSAQPAHDHPRSVRRAPSTAVPATAVSDEGRRASWRHRDRSKQSRPRNAAPSSAQAIAAITVRTSDNPSAPTECIATDTIPVAITAPPASGGITAVRLRMGRGVGVRATGAERRLAAGALRWP